ncbi:MAG: YdaU family protein [Nitrospira sp.]|nr:YdaU family protein [Nitrospira sp.]
MNRPPAYQFYPKDWLDFRVQRMSLAAQGAYMKLLCFMWKDSQDQCSIIDDDRAIATAIGVPYDMWKELRAEIQFPGDPILIEEGEERRILRSARLQREAEKQRNHSIKQAERGKRGAQKRWQKEHSQGHSSGHDPAIAGGMTENGSSSSSSLKELNKEDVLAQKPEKSLSPAKPSPKKQPIPISLPEGFTISDDLWEWGSKKNYVREWMEREFEKFCDRNRATGERYIDWEAAFRNWLLKAEEFAASRNGRPPMPNNGRALNRTERIPL